MVCWFLALVVKDSGVYLKLAAGLCCIVASLGCLLFQW